MSTLKVTSNKIRSELDCPTSKSYANRALILAALDPRECVLRCLPASKDVSDLICNLQEVGLDIETFGDHAIIRNSFPECEGEENLTLSGSEGGTTIRFLTSLLSLGKRSYRLPLLGRMGQRPLAGQVECLNQLGALNSLHDKYIDIQGPIELAKKVYVDCSHTTQFASSMLLLKGDVELQNIRFSKNYITLTRKLIEDFKPTYIIPPDFSSLSYLLAYGFLNQDIHILNIKDIDDAQGDSCLISVLRDIGAKISISEDGLKVKKGIAIKGIDLDISHCLDLFPTLGYLSMFIEQPCHFSGLGPLLDKESDRLSEMLKIFDSVRMSYYYDEAEQTLKTMPSKLEPNSQLLNLPNDHRIVMVAALILKHFGGGELNQSESVAKSFKEFFEIF